MSLLRLLCLAVVLVSSPALAEEAGPAEFTPVAPAFAPLPIPQLMATAASADAESAGRALSALLSLGSPDRALLRLLEAGTTQDARIARHFVERPTYDALPALLRALDRHDDGTHENRAVLTALRACVPLEASPPGTTEGAEDPRAWRDWARSHRRTTAAACLGRGSLSVLPLLWMLAAGRRREV